MQAKSSHPEYQYLHLLKDILESGRDSIEYNTGIRYRRVFGRQIRFDLSKGFPLLTTKKVYWKGILYELFWFLTGQSNIKYLVDRDVHIWDDYPYKIYREKNKERRTKPTSLKLRGSRNRELTKEEFVEKIRGDEEFAKKWGELPYIYGHLWRRWPTGDGRGIDQVKWAIDTLRTFPDRRHAVVSAWHPEHLYAMARPGKALNYPLCHILFHFVVIDGKVSCQLYQRSADMFLGVPFNIASYALLTAIIAHLAGYKPGEFVHTFGDAHVYENHLKQVREQVARKPRPFPVLKIDPKIRSLDKLQPEHVTLLHYDPHPPLKGELTVAGGFDEKDRRLFGRYDRREFRVKS
ncbi:thymidylate synthase [Candidatus Roizmanbacteria bacterium]|nr:thymidylate synthase [Candidatus Roizmanbacteria bacterium]